MPPTDAEGRGAGRRETGGGRGADPGGPYSSQPSPRGGGGRVNLWHDTVFGFANVILPLNRDGFRSDVIPLVGIEAAF